ncbi:Hsp20/alpha crystallin family protein [Mycolicibacterium moriokaense]|nr:Hsp20/alpha crystallin family protein [Mycolicibacterium moriokaense]
MTQLRSSSAWLNSSRHPGAERSSWHVEEVIEPLTTLIGAARRRRGQALVLVCRSPAGIVGAAGIFLPSPKVKRHPPVSGGIVNKLAVQRQSRPLLPELSHLVTGLPAFAGLRPFFDNHLLRLEDEAKEGLYEVRAELPGIDPIEDVEVTVHDGRLTIKALRTRTSETNGLSEFSYGSFSRTVTLPADADEDDITATYDRGILTVSVPLAGAEAVEKQIEVFEIAPLDDEDEDFDDAFDESDDGEDTDDAEDDTADGASDGHDQHDVEAY